MKSFHAKVVLAFAVLATAMIGGGCQPGENKSLPPPNKGAGESTKPALPSAETKPVAASSNESNAEKTVAPPEKISDEKSLAKSPSAAVKLPDETPVDASELPSLSAALEKSKKEEAANPKKEESPQPPPAPRDLGKPLVDNFDELKKLDKNGPLWLDPEQKRVVMVGEVCKPTYGLEMFATLKAAEKAYESVVVVDVPAFSVHAGLMALGAKPGKPVQYRPQFMPPSGPEIDVNLYWKDEKGKEHNCRAQEWIRNVNTKKALEFEWVFAGSGFWTDEKTKKEFYQGEGGYLICVANTPSAVLDLPTPSSGGLEARVYESFVEHMPPPGTPVTMTLSLKK